MNCFLLGGRTALAKSLPSKEKERTSGMGDEKSMSKKLKEVISLRGKAVTREMHGHSF